LSFFLAYLYKKLLISPQKLFIDISILIINELWLKICLAYEGVKIA